MNELHPCISHLCLLYVRSPVQSCAAGHALHIDSAELGTQECSRPPQLRALVLYEAQHGSVVTL